MVKLEVKWLSCSEIGHIQNSKQYPKKEKRAEEVGQVMATFHEYEEKPLCKQQSSITL
jgi:hypothetical protein